MSDTLVAKGSTAKYLSHPEGQFVAQCVDTINLGEKVEAFNNGPKKLVPKCALVYRTGERNPETGDYIDVAKEFTVSMGDLANLRKHLEQWRGKPYTPEQIEEGVPLHKLTGQHGLLSIAHKVSGNGRTYANITACVGVPKQMASQLPDYLKDYTRAEYWEERKKEYAEAARQFRTQSAVAPSDDDFPPPLEDDPDDLPFN